MISAIKNKILQSRKSGGFFERILFSIRMSLVYTKGFIESVYANFAFVNKKEKLALFPDFLVVGMQKSATSWLDTMLRKHAEIHLPPNRKELHFFDTHKWKGMNWYLYHFKEGVNKVKGEVTPAYSTLSIQEIKEIKSYNPKVKIIFLLRDPIERGWSHLYMDLVRHRGKGDQQVEIKDYVSAIEKGYLDERGNYLEILKRWDSVFPKEQIFIDFYESVSDDPEGLLSRIFAFLEVDQLDSSENIQYSKRVNENKSAKMPDEIADILKKKYINSLYDLYEFFPNRMIKNWIEKYN